MTKLEEYIEQVNNRLEVPASADELKLIEEKFLDNVPVGFTAGTIWEMRQEAAGQTKLPGFEG